MERKPNVVMFLLCDSVIEDKSGAMSVIRVIDRILVGVQADALPADVAIPMSLPYTAVIIRDLPEEIPFKLKIVHHPPAGDSYPTREVDGLLPVGRAGLNLVVTPKEAVPLRAGRHELHLLFNDEQIAMTSFDVSIEAAGPNPS